MDAFFPRLAIDSEANETQTMIKYESKVDLIHQPISNI
jgi:hypothetical protein